MATEINNVNENNEFDKIMEQILTDKSAPEGIEDFLLKLRTLANDENMQKELQKEKERRHGSALNNVATFLECLKENKWPYVEVDSERHIFMLSFRLSSFSPSLLVVIEEDAECVRFNTVLPISCEDEYKIVLALWMAETNSKFRYGQFNLDMEDGEISYCYCLNCNNATVSKEQLAMCILAVVRTVDEYYKPIIEIANGKFKSDEVEKNKYFKAIKKFTDSFKRG